MRARKFGIAICLSIFIVAMAMMGGLIGGFTGAVNELNVAIKENTAEAILASVEISNETVTSAPILYYDQVMDDCVNMYDSNAQSLIDKRQFEWKTCDYYNFDIEKGLVDSRLDSQYLPIGVGGEVLSNRGLATGFERWFNQVDGKSRSYAGAINLVYSEKDSSFKYYNEDFYPLDEIAPAVTESVNQDGHNHLFTLNLGLPFRVLANGKEEFLVSADDDTWVFVGDTMVLDMGGVHDLTNGKFIISDSGEVYASVDEEDFAYSGVNLNSGESAIVRIFHADRNSENSIFGVEMINMVPNVTNVTLAQNGEGVEVAYDPMNPSYVAPLGESLSVGPNNTKTLIVMMTVQIVAMGTLGVLTVMTISVAWRYSRRDHNQVK